MEMEMKVKREEEKRREEQRGEEEDEEFVVDERRHWQVPASCNNVEAPRST